MTKITPQELIDRFDRMWRECQRYYRVNVLPMPDQLEMKIGSIRRDLVGSLGIQEGPKVTKAEALDKIKSKLKIVENLKSDDPVFKTESHTLKQMIDVFVEIYKQDPEQLIRQQREAAIKKKSPQQSLLGND